MDRADDLARNCADALNIHWSRIEQVGSDGHGCRLAYFEMYSDDRWFRVTVEEVSEGLLDAPGRALGREVEVTFSRESLLEAPTDRRCGVTIPGRPWANERNPVICAEFEREGQSFQVVEWPETDDDAFEWDVVRSDLPYIWRDQQIFSPEFGTGQ